MQWWSTVLECSGITQPFAHRGEDEFFSCMWVIIITFYGARNFMPTNVCYPNKFNKKGPKRYFTTHNTKANTYI